MRACGDVAPQLELHPHDENVAAIWRSFQCFPNFVLADNFELAVFVEVLLFDLG
jgi:hypothetical protein